jgi:beta-N-acetylglucosaminidase
MKHKVEVIPKEEILANRSNAYEFIDFDKQETLEEDKLRQLFKNRSNCYADSEDVIQAMDEDCFINTVKEWFEQNKKK